MFCLKTPRDSWGLMTKHFKKKKKSLKNLWKQWGNLMNYAPQLRFNIPSLDTSHTRQEPPWQGPGIAPKSIYYIAVPWTRGLGKVVMTVHMTLMFVLPVSLWVVRTCSILFILFYYFCFVCFIFICLFYFYFTYFMLPYLFIFLFCFIPFVVCFIILWGQVMLQMCKW